MNFDFDLVTLSGRTNDKLIQFCLPLDRMSNEKQEALTFPRWWSEKYDGVFCLAIQYDNEIGIFSRTGERYVSMKHIEKEIWKLFNEDRFGNIVADGNNTILLFEAYTPETEQATISGWCRDTQNQHEELLAYCHTLMSLDDFRTDINGKFYIKDENRLLFRDMYGLLEKELKTREDAFKYLRFVEQIEVYSLKEAIDITKQVWNRLGEGGVLRNPNAPYKPNKRCDDMIKIKKVYSFDLEVLNIIEGKKGSKYEGLVGALKLRWRDGKTIKVSGMKDIERKEWMENPEKIIGKIVEVHGLAFTKTGVLREPRYRGIRKDKNVGDF